MLKKIGDRIVVKFPYNKDYVEKVKTIEGHRWNIEEKYWSFHYIELGGDIKMNDVLPNGCIGDIGVSYNTKIDGYTTLMSYMNKY